MWNCDEIGLDPNGKWRKVVCTYKYFQGERTRKARTGECAPLWCTLHVFTQADGQCFMTPVVVHQAKEYSQDIHQNIPLEWEVHHTPYGYMDRDGWFKAMVKLSNICGASPVSNQILFFNGHNSHFDNLSLTQTQSKKSSPS